MFQTVLFDLDGTLLNTIDDLAGAGNRVCAAHGWPRHTTEEFKYMVGNGIPKLVERFTPPECRDAATLQTALEEFKATYHDHMEDLTAPYPGMPELLAELKAAGVRLAVYSNKNDELARSMMAHYYDPALFDAVRGALPGVPHKPAPEGTLALMAALGADPAVTLYVGDSNVDVQTAKNAGLRCCGVLWGFRTREELRAAGAEYLAADAGALKQVILGG
ncbi:MAG: HAD family hydrolase [Gemmiger sp.]